VPSLSPDLAVEVVSETNTKVELAQKTREYFESGARLVWIVYPRPRPRTVAVFSQPSREPDHWLSDADTLDGGQVLPGFALPLIKLFKQKRS
jgi:Uma2 family endonuclease